MTVWLKQSTAVTVKLGPFIDDTDGKTAETGLTVTQAEVRLSKNGANIAQKNEATSLAADELGYYDCLLDTTDTNTLGVLRVMVHESGALPVWQDFMVVPANVWDSFFGADALQVHANEITAGLITAAAIATGAIDADAIADNAIDAGAIAADAITAAKIANGAIDAATFAAGAINAAAIADAAIDNATFAADVGSTAYATNIIALAVRKVLDALNLDHLCAVVTAAADMTTEVVDNSILSRILGNGDTSTFVPSTDGLHAAGVDLDAILADTDELQTDWADGGRLDLLLDGASAPTVEEIRAEIDSNSTQLAAIVADTGELQTDWADGGRLDLLLDGASAPTVEEIRAEIDSNSTQLAAIVADTDELQTDWADGGRLDVILDAASAGAGGGSSTVVITINDGTDPLEGAQVWITTDEAGSNIVASGTTDTLGQVTLYLDPGTYYSWVQLAGYNFTNPTETTVA